MTHYLYLFCVLMLGGFEHPKNRHINWQEFRLSGIAQGTTYHITYYASSKAIDQQKIDSILERIDSSLSIYKSYSLINAFNRSARGIPLDGHLKKVVTKSLKISRRTNGISDITVLPLVNAWGFGPEKVKEFPNDAHVSELLHCVGFRRIVLKKDSLIKTSPCVQIDVNGIAQGYTVDLLAAYLEARGVLNYLVELGGELRIRGNKQPGAKPFHIGVEAPDEEGSEDRVIQKILHLERGAVTTSGNFNKYHSSGGKRFSHLINPKTGFSFQNELISVTVVAKDAITADGYDNALMGMGLRAALRFLKTEPSLNAYFIYQKDNGSIADTATPGFYRYFNQPVQSRRPVPTLSSHDSGGTPETEHRRDREE